MEKTIYAVTYASRENNIYTETKVFPTKEEAVRCFDNYLADILEPLLESDMDNDDIHYISERFGEWYRDKDDKDYEVFTYDDGDGWEYSIKKERININI